MKRNIIFILVTFSAILLIIVLFFAFSLTQNNNAPQEPGLIVPTQVPLVPVRLDTIPQSTKVIPTTGPSQIDLSAAATQTSIQEISKLNNALPYATSFTSSVGIPIEIFIPGKNQQGRTWTLQVQTLGVNFQADPQTPKYALMRQSFREAAKMVFSFLESRNVSPSNIFITWGDRTYEQDTAEKWLQN